jgi:hypothetical protein
MQSAPNDNSESSRDASRPAPARLPRRKRWLRKLIAATFGLTVAIVIAEAALRMIGYSAPSFLRPHPLYGWLYKPQERGWFRLEGKAWSAINNRGFRDVEHTFEKPADVYRIVVLGDSYTAAQEVDFEETFSRIAERLLNEKNAGRKVEVINLGCSGYGTAAELLVWRNEGRLYHADLVLLAFFTGNDVTDNYPPLAPRPRPFFELKDGDLALNSSFVESSEYSSRSSLKWRLTYWLLEHSRLAQLLNMARLRWKSRPAAAAEGSAALEEAGIDPDVYRLPVDEDWQAAWQITESLLAQLDREVRAAGAEFAVVTLSNSSQVTPDEKRREQLTAQLKVENLLYPDERVAVYCAERKIPCLTLAPPLLARALQSGKPLHGFGESLGHGHWNQDGHEGAGQLIADWVAERFLPQKKLE